MPADFSYIRLELESNSFVVTKYAYNASCWCRSFPWRSTSNITSSDGVAVASTNGADTADGADGADSADCANGVNGANNADSADSANSADSPNSANSTDQGDEVKMRQKSYKYTNVSK